MASIVVNGDTSGAVTLSAPAVAGTVTVTLPSASGTMASLASVTANGVAYINSSGQPTSGSALVFDGTNLGLGVTPSAWGGSYKTFQLPGGSIGAFSTGAITTFQNAYDSGAGSYVYSTTAAASRYTQSQGLHQWFNAPSGTAGNAISFTQAMTLGSDGLLQVAQTTGGIGDGKLQVAATGTGSGAANTKAGLSVIEYDSGNAAGIWLGSMTNQNTGVIGTRTATGNLAFQTYNGGWGERMRLTYTGRFLIGGTNETPYSDTTGSGSTAMWPNRLFVSSDADCGSFNRIGSDGIVWYWVRGGTGNVGNVSVSTTGTGYNSTSDYRLKNVTGSLTGYKERLMALQPKQGTWIADGSEFKGFLAHEFANQYPKTVTGEKDAVDADGKPMMQSMEASSAEVIADLVALAQEQQALITQLQADVAALKGAA